MAITKEQQAALDAVEIVIEQADTGVPVKIVRIPVSDKNGEPGYMCIELPEKAADADVKAAMVKLVSQIVQVADPVDGVMKSKPVADIQASKLPTETAISNVTTEVNKVIADKLAAVVASKDAEAALVEQVK
jgi:hypothetical protein